MKLKFLTFFLFFSGFFDKRAVTSNTAPLRQTDYSGSFRSFSPIHPALRSSAQTAQAITEGRMKQIIRRPVQSNAVMAVLVPAAISFSQPV